MASQAHIAPDKVYGGVEEVVKKGVRLEVNNYGNDNPPRRRYQSKREVPGQ